MSVTTMTRGFRRRNLNLTVLLDSSTGLVGAFENLPSNCPKYTIVQDTGIWAPVVEEMWLTLPINIAFLTSKIQSYTIELRMSCTVGNESFKYVNLVVFTGKLDGKECDDVSALARGVKGRRIHAVYNPGKVCHKKASKRKREAIHQS